MRNPFYYFHVWFHRHLFGFCPECNSSAPEIDNCPICHNDRTSPFNKKKKKRYWLRWRVLHGYTHNHYTNEEKLFLIEQQLDIPYNLRYYNTKKYNFGTLTYCKKTDTIRTKENYLLLFRNENIWSNIWLLTFDHAVDDKLVHLTYKYLQQATGFTTDGQIMVNGLNRFIEKNNYGNKQ